MSNLEIIPFAGSTLVATRDGRGIWLSLRRACESIGIDVDSQRKRLKEAAWAVTVEITATGPDGKSYQMTGLHIDSVPMWLATIQTNKVAPGARERLVEYQLKAATVLRDHFMPQRAEIAPAFDPSDPRVVVAVIRSLDTKVLALEATVTEQVEVIAELEPKAATYDALMESADTYGFRESVKHLHRTTAVTEREVRTLLIDRGWVQRLGGTLLPASYGEQREYVTTRVNEYTDPKGVRRSSSELRITNKGLARLQKLLTRADAA